MSGLLFLPDEVSELGVSDGVQLQLGDVVGRVGAGLPPAVRPLPPTGAQYGGVGLPAVLHHPTASKCFRNTGGGAAGGAAGRGDGAHICTQTLLS